MKTLKLYGLAMSPDGRIVESVEEREHPHVCAPIRMTGRSWPDTRNGWAVAVRENARANAASADDYFGASPVSVARQDGTVAH